MEVEPGVSVIRKITPNGDVTQLWELLIHSMKLTHQVVH